MDVEVVSFQALEKVFVSAKEKFEREHVTPYFYESHPSRFKSGVFKIAGFRPRPGIRVTLDTSEDYALLCAVYAFLYPRNNYFNLYDIIRLFRKHPWLELINGNVTQKKVLHNLGSEIAEAVKILARQDLSRVVEFLKSAKK
jgi:spore coat polysaccharide biosynthesis protein SpsF